MSSQQLSSSVSNEVGKLPPQNLDAEMSVLGAMLFDVDALPRVIELLKPDQFYLVAHRKIYTSMLTLFDASAPVDIVTLSEALRKSKDLDAVGGVVYLSRLAEQVATAANIEQYARIVKEKALLRSMIRVGTTMVEECFDPSADASELLDMSEKAVFEISQSKIEGHAVALKDLIKGSIETIDQLYQKREHVTGLATGFHEFDLKTAGLHPADLLIVAGRPSMGKSALAACMAEYIGADLKKGVAIFSLEMSKESLVQRFLCSRARVDAQKVRTGYLSHEDWPKLTAAAGQLSEAPIFIDDTPAITVLELRAKARRLKSQFDIQLIIVDYLQLMRGGSRMESRQQEISEISRGLKAVARELGVPVMAISQLSRAVESRTGNRPMLSDLRESGAIEQDADVVVFVFREEYYNPTEENRNKAEVIIAKQRNGPVGTMEMVFIKEWTRFENPDLFRDHDEISE